MLKNRVKCDSSLNVHAIIIIIIIIIMKKALRGDANTARCL